VKDVSQTFEAGQLHETCYLLCESGFIDLLPILLANADGPDAVSRAREFFDQVLVGTTYREIAKRQDLAHLWPGLVCHITYVFLDTTREDLELQVVRHITGGYLSSIKNVRTYADQYRIHLSNITEGVTK